MDAHPLRSVRKAGGRRRLGRAARRALVVLAVAAAPGLALAATVKGRIVGTAKLFNPVWAEAKEPDAYRYTFREPSPTVRPDVRALVGHMPKELCIAALGETGKPAQTPLRVVVAGGRTTPVTLVVAPGQQIQFENRDPFPHKLYEATGKGGLPPGDTLPTKTRAWTPPGPGKYEIRDQAAPSVRSWIVVEPKVVAVAYPDRKGEFSIDLEPGKYKLRGYFAGEPVGTEMAVDVAAGNETLRNPLAVGEVADAGAGGAR